MTETTIDSTYFDSTQTNLSLDGLIPIGCPFSNTQTYIFNSHQQLVPIGVPGELYIGGIGLARGYLNQPELTVERFIPNPFSEVPEARLYKTGDLARYRPDGNIEYLGRMDNQVKIRGFRIELDEIEANLTQHPTVRESVVIIHEISPSDKRLVAYCLPQKDQVIDNTVLRAFLTEKLTDYMVPSAFVQIDAIPLTPNGKVDRRTLQLSAINYHSEGNTLENTFIAPRTPEEEIVATVWTDVLGVERIGIHDNFFDMGGDSLLTTQIVSHLQEICDVRLPIDILLEKPTVEGIAKAIEQTYQQGAIVATKAVIDFDAEAILDSTIQPLAISRNIFTKPRSILLTGATGFLGIHLLHELLIQTTADIYCLVRFFNRDENNNRLQHTLESYSLWNDNFLPRIIPIEGDLSKPLLGMSKLQFHHFASQIDVIYHNAAWVNYLYPYSVLKATNVLGTQEVLRLASQVKTKPVHFISTIDVLSSHTDLEVEKLRESDCLKGEQVVDSGYAQSKWVAEQLVRCAGERGLPVCIYRLARIAGHSQTGVSNVNDFVNLLIKGCIQLGKLPDFDWMEDNMMPLDYVSGTIVHLSQQTDLLGETFHLLNSHSFLWGDLFNWLRSLGYPLEPVSSEQWLFELSHQKENVLYPLSSLFSQENFSDKKQPHKWSQYDCQNTLEGLAGTDIVCPRINTELLNLYFSYFRKSGFLEAPLL